jgi:hypothetical protein
MNYPRSTAALPGHVLGIHRPQAGPYGDHHRDQHDHLQACPSALSRSNVSNTPVNSAAP